MKVFTKKGNRLAGKLMSVLCSLAVILGLFAIRPVEARADGEQYVMLDLVVYYNDSEAGCFDKVIGDQLKITGDGTYTMTFDCSTALAYEQTSLGVNSLTNLGAVYLIDDLYLSGISPRSIVNSFDLTYDSLKVDGTEIELADHDTRSAIKSAGQVDSNGPVNAWEDCRLAEGTYTVTDEYVLNFTGLEEPKVLELTFTVSNMVFTEQPTTTAAETTTEEETEEPTTEEVTETTQEPTAEATEAPSETEAAAQEQDNEGSSTIKAVVVIVLVVILLAVIVLVVKKLKK